MASPNRAAMLALAVAVFVVIGMLGFSVANDAVGTSTGTQTVTNESVTAQYDTAVELEGYELVSGTVTVYNASGSVVPSSEYTIDHGPGTINVSSSSTSIADGEEIAVTYDYQATGPLTTLVVGFIPIMIALLIFVRVAGPIQDML